MLHLPSLTHRESFREAVARRIAMLPTVAQLRDERRRTDSAAVLEAERILRAS